MTNFFWQQGGVEECTEEGGKFVVVNIVDVYNCSTNRWSTPKALEFPKALRSHHVVVFKEHIYLAAGATTFLAPPEVGNPQAWKARWSDVIEAVEQPSQLVGIIWTPVANPPALRSAVISYNSSLFSVGGVIRSMPQKAIYKFDPGKPDNPWIEVGNLSVGRFRHGVVPLGIHATIYLLLVAGGYVQGKSKGDESNEKSNSVELVLL